MNIDEMTKEFESRFPYVHPIVGDMAIAPTGEQYVSVSSGATDDEPAPLYLSEKSCVRALLFALAVYAVGKAGTLYWRTRPEINPYELYGRTRSTPAMAVWTGFARLLISDKPVIGPATGPKPD